MRTPRLILLLFVFTVAACDSDIGSNQAPTASSAKDAAVSNTAPPADSGMAPAKADAGAARTDAGLAKDSGAMFDKPPSQQDARAPGANAPISCVKGQTYAIDFCSEWPCRDGAAAMSTCNDTGNGYVVWDDTDSICRCPDLPDAGVAILPPPQLAPPETMDAATTQPPLPHDASLPNFPAFLSTDAAQIDAPQPSITPDASIKPDFSFPAFLPGPEAPDAKVVASTPPDAEPIKVDAKLQPDTAAPQPRLDCGCEEPIPPAIIADASPPDTMLIALPPDAGTPDVIVIPDVMPDTTPDMLPDTQPDTTPDTTPPPDAGCTSVVSITITANQLVCGTMINWTVVGCSPMGFKVVWSLNEGPIYPTRAGDNFNYVSDPAARSHEIHDVNGAGTYYVRVCEYVGGACGVYSNELTVSMDR